MKRYLRKILLFFSPLFVVFVLYFLLDPFKVVWSYDQYYMSGRPDYVVLNRGHVSTETFLQQHPRRKYDAFIFGNSRSLFYQAADWKKHIGETASCFHFDGSDESLFSLHRKVKFLDEQGVRIRHALMVLDHSLLYRAEAHAGHLVATSPRLMSWGNVLTFHGAFLLAYLDPRFLLAYYDFMLFGTFRDYMRDHNVLNAEPMTYDPVTNEISYPQFERAIADGSYYTGKRLAVFRKRAKNPAPYSPTLGREHIRLLKEMQRIFAHSRTDLRIIISPLYNQRPLSPRDLAILRDIFGDTHLFDFSGRNPITTDHRNYYELSHYRPTVAARILDQVYNTEPKR